MPVASRLDRSGLSSTWRRRSDCFVFWPNPQRKICHLSRMQRRSCNGYGHCRGTILPRVPCARPNDSVLLVCASDDITSSTGSKRSLLHLDSCIASFVAFACWWLVKDGTEALWAAPLLSHAVFLCLSMYLWRKPQESMTGPRRDKVLLPLIILAGLVCTCSLALLIGSIHGWPGFQFGLQSMLWLCLMAYIMARRVLKMFPVRKSRATVEAGTSLDSLVHRLLGHNSLRPERERCSDKAEGWKQTQARAFAYVCLSLVGYHSVGWALRASNITPCLI